MAKKAKKKTAKKKATKKTTVKKAAKKAKPTVAFRKGKAGVDPDQKQLDGFDEDRVAAVERVVKKVVDLKSQRSAIKEEIDELVNRLPPLFKKHKLTQYSCYGKTVVVEPGADIVKIKKATTN